MYTKFWGRIDTNDNKKPPLPKESVKNATVKPRQKPLKADINGTIKIPA